MPPTDIATFAATQLRLLQKELNAEKEETHLLTSTHAPSTLHRAGLALVNLSVSSQRTGLGGRTLVELGIDSAVGGGELPEHGLRVGDICAVAEQPKGAERKKERQGMEKTGVDGVVTRIHRESVTIALDQEEAVVPYGGKKLWLYVSTACLNLRVGDSVIDRLIDLVSESRVKLANDTTHKRLQQTMTRLQKMQDSEHSTLTRVLFGHASPTPISPEDLEKAIEWRDQSLNPSQKDAVNFALASREVCLIHGPPGTGKTHTLIELILQLLARGQRLLVCGPSNISVDNIVERLAPHKVPMVRLGHPARLLPAVLNHSLEVLTRTSEAADIVADVRSEMDAKQASIRKTRNGRERRAIYGEMRDLRKEYRQREEKVVRDLMQKSKVVLSTLHGAGGYHMKNQRFDVVVVDEASQALEAQCWIPVLNSGATMLVLAGDHLQLPPTIKSTNAKTAKSTLGRKTDKQSKASGKPGAMKGVEDHGSDATSSDGDKTHGTLETTLFDRILSMHGKEIKRMLTIQYRMHEKIMAFPSRSLYGDKLIAAEAVKARLLEDLPYGVMQSDDTVEPLVFWDTQGGDFAEKPDDDDEPRSRTKGSLLADSKVNGHEAAIVHMHVSRLVDAGVKAEDIAVVTPYNGQVALLAQTLKSRFPGIELGSVDGFQGREKEAVVVSLVRSNSEFEVGFLAERRRLNGQHTLSFPFAHNSLADDASV